MKRERFSETLLTSVSPTRPVRRAEMKPESKPTIRETEYAKNYRYARRETEFAIARRGL